MANVHAGYMGTATVAGNSFRFNNCSLMAKQEVQTEDLVMGDWNKDAYVYGKISVGGGIGGPVTETFATGANSILTWACKRSACGLLTPNSVDLYYYCDSTGKRSRTFSNVYVNTLNFDCTAGEICNFSLDLLGTDFTSWGSTSPTRNTKVEKLLTWDKVNLVVGSQPLKYSTFSFTVSNNLNPVYALGQANLKPYDIVPGLLSITGSITMYDISDAFDGWLTWNDYGPANTLSAENTLTFYIGTTPITIKAQFNRLEPTLTPGVITSTVAFTGVGPQTGTIWS